MVKIFVCAALAVCAAACLCGCYDAGTFSAGSAQFSAEEVRSLSVDVSDREVEIVPSSGESVVVEYFASEREYYDVTLSEDGELKVALVTEREWTQIIASKPQEQYRTLKIYLPAALEGVAVSTTNEDIIFGEVTADTIDLYSNGGSVRVSGACAGEISLAAKNGDIVGYVAGSYADYSISVTIKKGESNLAANSGGERLLNLNCNNGDIDIKFAG